MALLVNQHRIVFLHRQRVVVVPVSCFTLNLPNCSSGNFAHKYIFAGGGHGGTEMDGGGRARIMI